MVVNQAAGCRVVVRGRDARGVTVLGEQCFLEQFVVGARVVVRSGPAMMGHAALMVARCCGLRR